MNDSAASIREAAAQIELRLLHSPRGIYRCCPLVQSVQQSSMSSAIATLQGALGTEGLDEGTAATINSAIEQLNAGLESASAAQGELGNIRAQSQVAVGAETNGTVFIEMRCVLRGAAGISNSSAELFNFSW